jgi:hypothetical protein
MQFEEIKKSSLSNLDKTVEMIYVYCDCMFCKLTGANCPFVDSDEEDLDVISSECKKIIRDKILEIGKQ